MWFLYLKLVLFGLTNKQSEVVRHNLEQYPVITPSAEVVFVKDNKIPIHIMDELILCLDTASIVGSQEVLEGTEDHNGLGLVNHSELLIDVDIVVSGFM